MAETETKRIEDREQKFIRIAARRVNKVLNEFRLLTNLMQPNYKSTRQQRDKIISTLRTAIDEIEYTFSGEKTKEGVFTFDETKIQNVEE